MKPITCPQCDKECSTRFDELTESEYYYCPIHGVVLKGGNIKGVEHE